MTKEELINALLLEYLDAYMCGDGQTLDDVENSFQNLGIDVICHNLGGEEVEIKL